jgi:hypothetical protein
MLVAILILFLVLGSVWQLNLIPAPMLDAIFVGISLALFFVVSGFFIYLFATDYNQQKFTFWVIGAGAGRLILLLAGVALVVKFSTLDKAVVTISMISSYFVFQIIEVVGFTKVKAKEII